MKLVFVLMFHIVLAGSQAQIRVRCSSDVSRPIQLQDGDQLSLRTDVVIPIVFHVVWHEDEENITDQQIRSQVEILNGAFASGTQASTAILDIFKDYAAKPGLRFCLADRDPEGVPTDGILRRYAEEAFLADKKVRGRTSIFYDEFGGSNAWDPSRYINVWIAVSNRFAGYATFPGEVDFPEEEGIIIDPSYIGNIGSAQQNRPFHQGKTLVHEMGHYFGLRHIWGSFNNPNCADDDGIEDTPPQAQAYSGCPFGTMISCNSPDMYQNHMDFTDDNCSLFFTIGQADKIQSVLKQYRPGLLEQDICTPKTNADPPISISYGIGAKLVHLTNLGDQILQGQLRIIDLKGSIHYEQRKTLIDQIYIPVEYLATGVYIIQFYNEQLLALKKIIIY